jgi:hypothetical protein
MVGDRLGGEGATPVRLGEREVELGGSVVIEQAEKSTRGPAEMSAVLGDLLEERLSAGASGHDAIAAAVLARTTLAPVVPCDNLVVVRVHPRRPRARSVASGPFLLMAIAPIVANPPPDGQLPRRRGLHRITRILAPGYSSKTSEHATAREC